jgi:hypothetical protein
MNNCMMDKKLMKKLAQWMISWFYSFAYWMKSWSCKIDEKIKINDEKMKKMR